MEPRNQMELPVFIVQSPITLLVDRRWQIMIPLGYPWLRSATWMATECKIWR